MSALSNLVAAEVGRILGNHCRPHNLGWIFAAELGYRCFPWNPDKVRRADVSFIHRDRYSLAQLSEDRVMTIPPDLAVEVVSANDLVEKLDEKVDEYLRAGVRLIWIVRPAARAIEVFRKDRSVSWFWAADEISGEDVLPGFRCKVDDFFPPRGLGELQGSNGAGNRTSSPTS